MKNTLICIRIVFVLFFLFAAGYLNAQQGKSKIEEKAGAIVLNFAADVSSLKNAANEIYTIQRAGGRFGNYQTIGTTKNTSFVDADVTGNPYDYYYRVTDAQGNIRSALALNEELFGTNLYIYSPEDNVTSISNEINAIHDEMFHDQFSSKRYAFFFKPGDYTGAGVLNVAYYMHIGGLGKTPHDVKLNNIDTPAPLSDNNATCTFWRSIENFSALGASGEFTWGVSQAAPIRRIYSQRNARYDKGGWASGGFTADCYFEGGAGSYSQQQWYTRNSYLNKGRGPYSTGNWNTCYQGVEFGAGVNMADHSDNWSTGGKVSRVETTPVVREKPFLFLGDDGRYKIFRPALRTDSKGVSWGENTMGEGTSYDLLDDFYVVKPGASAQTMNQQLAAGKHLFITPGRYELSEPLRVNNPNTIVLGSGYATLIPGQENTSSAIIIGDVEGVTIAGLLLDALYNSRTLLQAGTNATKNHSANPTLLADLFFRIGGFVSTNVNVDIALEINSSDVIGDHFWIWRADHGSGVGWTRNTSKNGLIVNGHYVTIYGLFNEHFQEYQTLWNGEKGRTYFYQSETPYDPTNQNLYMSHDGTVNGYADYKVADHVNYHEASMLGMYDVFINTNGAKIIIENSMEVPNSKGVKIHHVCNVRLSNVSGAGFNYVINGNTGSTAKAGGTGTRFYVVDYTGTEEPDPFDRPVDTGMINLSLEADEISVYPNPVRQYLHIKTDDNRVQIMISDLNGKIIHKQTGTSSIRIVNYDKGFYLITAVFANGNRKTVKIVKN